MIIKAYFNQPICKFHGKDDKLRYGNSTDCKVQKKSSYNTPQQKGKVSLPTYPPRT